MYSCRHGTVEVGGVRLLQREPDMHARLHGMYFGEIVILCTARASQGSCTVINVHLCDSSIDALGLYFLISKALMYVRSNDSTIDSCAQMVSPHSLISLRCL
jgi:hypothetical protein